MAYSLACYASVRMRKWGSVFVRVCVCVCVCVCV